MPQNPTEGTRPIPLVTPYRGMNDRQDSLFRPRGTVRDERNILDTQINEARRRRGRIMDRLESGAVGLIFALDWDDGRVSVIVDAGGTIKYDTLAGYRGINGDMTFAGLGVNGVRAAPPEPGDTITRPFPFIGDGGVGGGTMTFQGSPFPGFPARPGGAFRGGSSVREDHLGAFACTGTGTSVQGIHQYTPTVTCVDSETGTVYSFASIGGGGGSPQGQSGATRGGVCDQQDYKHEGFSFTTTALAALNPPYGVLQRYHMLMRYDLGPTILGPQLTASPPDEAGVAVHSLSFFPVPNSLSIPNIASGAGSFASPHIWEFLGYSIVTIPYWV